DLAVAGEGRGSELDRARAGDGTDGVAKKTAGRAQIERAAGADRDGGVVRNSRGRMAIGERAGADDGRAGTGVGAVEEEGARAVLNQPRAAGEGFGDVGALRAGVERSAGQRDGRGPARRTDEQI